MGKTDKYMMMLKKLKIHRIKGNLYELKKRDFITVPSKISEGYKVGFLSDGEGVELIRDNSVKVAFQRMEREGQICAGAYIDGRLVGHASCILPEKDHGAFKVRKSAYIHYCYVSPEYRGYNIYPSLLSWIIQKVIKEYGIERLTITTVEDNVSSQKGLKKVGFQFVRKYSYIEWWRFIWKRIVV